MREEISRLMDGDLDQEGLDALCAELRRSGGSETWACYHLIGDALRGNDGVAPGFARRFGERLAAEPVVLAPRPVVRRPLTLAWAAAATIAAVTLTGWVAVSVIESAPGASAVASAREAGVVRASQVRPASVPADYLIAHQEFAPNVQFLAADPALRPVVVETRP